MALGRRGFRPQGFIDIKEVAAKLGISRAATYALIKDNADFPKYRSFGDQTTLYRESEIDAWISKCVEEADRNAGVPAPGKVTKQAKLHAKSADPFKRFAADFSAMMRGLRTETA